MIFTSECICHILALWNVVNISTAFSHSYGISCIWQDLPDFFPIYLDFPYFLWFFLIFSIFSDLSLSISIFPDFCLLISIFSIFSWFLSIFPDLFQPLLIFPYLFAFSFICYDLFDIISLPALMLLWILEMFLSSLTNCLYSEVDIVKGMWWWWWWW